MDLCTLAKNYGVDKCPAIRHSYTPAYHTLLNGLRDTTKLVLEIGIGNAPLMVPIVGRAYKPGASLRMWRDYFPGAQILGCDILESVLFKDERIDMVVADQSNEASLKALGAYTKTFGEYVDIIVDDGSHVVDHMRLSFKVLWAYVRPGGLYIIEDIQAKHLEQFKTLHTEFGFTDAELVYSHTGNNHWDSFVVFRKVKA